MPGESPSARLTAALARLSAEASVVLASPARRNRALAVSGALLGVLYYLRRTAPGPAKPAAKDGKEKEKDAGRGKVDAEFFRWAEAGRGQMEDC